ncbi:MAG: hypothetical protein HUK14_06275 [Muribaculaceae bacterium]|nr:hypothetical protein [Muribaculaceae bacterium]
MSRKSSLATLLAIGVLRSALNQIGRDGGRTVSNQLYGNSYSAPVRFVNGYSAPNQQEFDFNLPDDMVERMGIVQNTIGFEKIILLILLAILFTPLSSVLFIVMGISKLSSKEDTTFVKLKTPMGKLPFQASHKVIQAIRRSGKIYLIIGIASLVWLAAIFLYA